MKCIKCKKIINKNDTFCRFCGNNNTDKLIIYKETNKKYNRLLIIIISIISFLFLLETSFNVWYFFIRQNNETVELKINSYDYKPKLSFKEYKVGETFIFDDLEITISKNYTEIVLENPYSLYNGKNVVKIPITIKNISNKDNILNIYHYNIYDNNGNLIDEASGYFEESLYYSEDIKKDEELTKYLFPLYYGNNEYIIKFENNNETIYVIYSFNKS